MKTKDLIADLATRSEKPDFTPTRAAGLARLTTFAGHAGELYDRCRNYDLSAEGTVRQNYLRWYERLYSVA